MECCKAGLLITEIHDLLYRLGIRATIQGFFETSGAVFLVMQQSDRSWFSIMEVYRRVSMLYHVEIEVVDLRIRRVIRKVWNANPELLDYLAGRKLTKRPTPRQFIEILCRYLTVERRY